MSTPNPLFVMQFMHEIMYVCKYSLKKVSNVNFLMVVSSTVCIIVRARFSGLF